MGRILGLDYGRRRIGVAVSDPLGLTAQPLDVWSGLEGEEVMANISALVEELGVEKVVVGFPLTLKGERGRMADEVERFTQTLSRCIPIPVVLWDERFTSRQAQDLLQKTGAKPSRDKGKIDLVASVLLLQNYIEYHKGSSTNGRGMKR